MIQDLEDQNIFILDHIEKSESELEIIHLKAKNKYKGEERTIAQLQKNNSYFEKMIKEKKEKKVALEIQMAKIRGNDPNKMSRNSL